MRNEGGEFFLLLVIATFLFWDTNREIPNFVETRPVIESVTTTPASVDVFRVEYEVQIGEIYTGVPTPVFERGDLLIEAIRINRHTATGLPANDWLPPNIKLLLFRDQVVCELHIPVTDPELIGVFKCKGTLNWVFHKAYIAQLEQNRAVIKSAFYES